LRWKKKLVVRCGNEKALRTWICALATDSPRPFPGKSAMKPEAAGIDRLRKDVAKLGIGADMVVGQKTRCVLV